MQSVAQLSSMIEWDYPSPFLVSATVQLDHIDGLGHANNTIYVSWCEKVAWQHSKALGLSVEDYQLLGRGMAIKQASYDYIVPCFANDELLLGTWLTASDGKLRMERSFQIVGAKRGDTLFRGRWQLISVNLETGRPTRMPQCFKDVYEPVVISNTL
jgi:acyl-CoA thioester hydrolase